jgi:hypothetical protein
VVLDAPGNGIIAVDSGLEHNERLHRLPAIDVRNANDGAFEYRFVLQHRRLHLGRADVVTGGDNEVVGARLEVHVAVVVHRHRVTGEVPAALHVGQLPLIGQVAATGGTTDGKPSHGAVRHGSQRLIEHRDFVARHRPADRAVPDVLAGGLR